MAKLLDGAILFLREVLMLGNQRGSTTLVVIVTLIALSSVSAFLLSYAQKQKEISVRIKGLNERVIAEKQVGLILSDPDVCRLSLGGQAVASDQSLIFNYPGSVPTKPFLNPGMKIGDQQLDAITWRDVAVISGELHSAKIELKLAKRSYFFPIEARVVGGVLAECYGDVSAPAMCQEVGGVYDFAAKRCDVKVNKLFASSCPDGQILKGFDSEGSIICQAI